MRRRLAADGGRRVEGIVRHMGMVMQIFWITQCFLETNHNRESQDAIRIVIRGVEPGGPIITKKTLQKKLITILDGKTQWFEIFPPSFPHSRQ